MPTQNVSLSEHFYDFIQQAVASGRYHNASEVVRAALRVLEQQEREDAARLERLRRLVEEADASLARGEAIELETEEDSRRFFEEKRQRVKERSRRDDAA